MKILDSSTLICIFDELDRPDLVDKISQLGHDLAVPRYVLERELRSKAKRRTEELAAAGAVKILENSAEEFEDFLKSFPGLGSGECHVMLSYTKEAEGGRKAYCVLDERDARACAADAGIKYIGLIGLLRMPDVENVPQSHGRRGSGRARSNGDLLRASATFRPNAAKNPPRVRTSRGARANPARRAAADLSAVQPGGLRPPIRRRPGSATPRGPPRRGSRRPFP